MADLVTMIEAIEKLGRTRRCLEQWRNAGCPGFSESCGMVLVNLDDVLAWVKSTGRKLPKRASGNVGGVGSASVGFVRSDEEARPIKAVEAVSVSHEEFEIDEIEDPILQAHFRAVERVLWSFHDAVSSQLGEASKADASEILRKGLKRTLNAYFDDVVERENYEISGIGEVLEKLDEVIISEKLSLLRAASDQLCGSMKAK